MGQARNLYNLQNLELKIDSFESQIAALTTRLNDRRVLDEAASRLRAAKGHLEELKKRQHSLDWEIEDIAGKLTKESQALYSGRISSPKELTSLKYEADTLQKKKSGLEDAALELMEQVEKAEADVSARGQDLKRLEMEWRLEREGLSAELERLKSSLSELNKQRAQTLAAIGQEMATLYCELKKQKGRAIAVVEQGVCRSCGLSLSSAWLQRARGPELVRCSSCGRILFLE